MKRFVLLLTVLSATLASGQSGSTVSNPKVRAITGFVRLNPADYNKQVSDALVVLRKLKADFEASGYEVETVRLTTQPLAELVSGMSEEQALSFLTAFDQLAAKENFAPNVGPAMMHDSDDPGSMHLLERLLATASRINASAIIADQDGIHWKTIRRSAELVKYVSEHSPRSQGTFNFAVTAMLKPLGPFFPGSYHVGRGNQFSMGFEAANLVQSVLAKDKDNMGAAVADLTSALAKHAQAAETIGKKIASETGWTYVGIDPTPAPLGDVSIGAAIESFSGAKFGSSGTLTAARVITTAVKAVPVTQVGYAGLMVPVMEDKVLAQRWAESTYNIDSLLAYSAVCGTGLDTVPLPGEITVGQVERIFGDVASLATKWNKPLSARLQPIVGKKAGDTTDFDSQFLFNTTVRAVP
jgi:uncharacterized protein (UPF0210 family)